MMTPVDDGTVGNFVLSSHGSNTYLLFEGVSFGKDLSLLD
jgi:hypothetical protein